MRHYEIMIILDPNLEERTVQPSLEGFLKVVTADGGKVGKLDIWGKRRLSYPIDKKPEGIYAIVDLTANPGAVQELDRQLNLNEGVLRTKVLRPEHRSQHPSISSAKTGSATMAAGDTPITVVGNLVADPELRFTPAGQPVATFRIASTPRIMRQRDERVEGRRQPLPHLQRLAAGGGERGRVAAARHAGHRDRPAQAAEL